MKEVTRNDAGTREVLRFEQCSVIRVYDDDGTYPGKGLHVQVIDAYAYQRELHVRYTRIYDHSVTPITSRMGWQVSAYKHPFRPPVQTEVLPSVAGKLMARIMDLARNYPILLFNGTGEGVHDARAEGFVHFHDALLAGARPSVTLLP